MKGKIIVKTLAGLSNRLRAIESGLSLAERNGSPCEVVWVPDPQMVAHYSELFVPPDKFELFPDDRYKYARSSFSLKGIKKPLSKVINQYYGIEAAFSDLDVRPLIWSGKVNLPEYCNGRTCYFFTCQNFFSATFRYSWLQPIPEIEDKLGRFGERVAGRSMIGLHIRRTDNEMSISESPDALFEKAIEDEIKKNADVVFFLATDDKPTEKKFIDKYGDGRILVNPKRFGRDSVEATRDAVVDLFSLSRCRRLYCSFYSSFSETAALISSAETIICKREPV